MILGQSSDYLISRAITGHRGRNNGEHRAAGWSILKMRQADRIM